MLLSKVIYAPYLWSNWREPKLLCSKSSTRITPKTKATLNFSNSGYPPLAPSEENKKLLVQYSSVSEDLGFGKVEAVHPINAGAADVSFTSGLVDAAMDGLGLSGGKDHTIEEFSELHRFPVLIKRAAVFLYRLSNE